MSKSCKSFLGLEDDYAFFEECVGEKVGTLQAWSPFLNELKGRKSSLKILDFGAGNGQFTQQILELACSCPNLLELSLLEPTESSRIKARELFTDANLSRLEVVASLDELQGRDFDLILSHHVFYYVPKLEGVLRELKSKLGPQGCFLASITGERSGAGGLQQSALDLAGLSNPYWTGPQCLESFLKVFPEAKTMPFQMSLDMQDSLENRASILRFLVGEFREQLPWKEALRVFDPFSDGKRISVPSDELCLAAFGD